VGGREGKGGVLTVRGGGRKEREGEVRGRFYGGEEEEKDQDLLCCPLEG